MRDVLRILVTNCFFERYVESIYSSMGVSGCWEFRGEKPGGEATNRYKSAAMSSSRAVVSAV
jgi:hypothetical protein